jgi:hypothetical protein
MSEQTYIWVDEVSEVTQEQWNYFDVDIETAIGDLIERNNTKTS